MGRGKLAIWLRVFRGFLAGLVLAYTGVILAVGPGPIAKPLFYALSAIWFLMVMALSFRPPRAVKAGSSVKPPWAWLELAAVNLALALLFAESALQGWAAATSSNPFVRANLDAYRLTPGRDYGGGLIGNSRGYPGPDIAPQKKPGVFRIAALGDSFAVGPAVPFAENYLTLLADELPGVEVANFGVSSAGPREYREILEREVWMVQPDLVLISLFVGNDITESLPRPRAFDPRRHALYLLLQRGGTLAHAAWQRSDVTMLAPADRFSAPPLSSQAFREVEGRRMAICLKEPAPAMEKKWQRALADLDAIVQSCRRHGIPAAVVLIPDEFQVNDAVLQLAMGEAGLMREQLDLDSPQRRLLQNIKANGTPCLDLLPAFRGTADTYAERDTHWNAAGNRLAAKQIAEWLRQYVIKL